MLGVFLVGGILVCGIVMGGSVQSLQSSDCGFLCICIILQYFTVSMCHVVSITHYFPGNFGII